MLRACRDRLRAEEKPLGIESRREGRYRFADPAFAAYLDCRAGLVTALAGRLADWFHGRGLAVGLDLFSPLLAPFVGQDYGALSKKADFVKPMLYRYTDTPAGIFYELRGIARAFAPAGREEAYFRALCEAAGARPEEGGGACYSAELAAARALCACEVLAGMELHTVPGRPPVTAGQVGDSVRRAARGGAAGAVASWNLLAAPEETVRAFRGDAKGEMTMKHTLEFREICKSFAGVRGARSGELFRGEGARCSRSWGRTAPESPPC